MILADMAVLWKLPDGGSENVKVTVHVEGELGVYRCEVPTRAFAASIGLALDFDGMDGSSAQDGLYSELETLEVPPLYRWWP